MKGRWAAAVAAIESPIAVHYSASDPDCRLYYASAQVGEGSTLMICVAADAVALFVKTAYLTKRIKPGEQKWPPPKQSKGPPDSSGFTTT